MSRCWTWREVSGFAPRERGRTRVGRGRRSRIGDVHGCETHVGPELLRVMWAIFSGLEPPHCTRTLKTTVIPRVTRTRTRTRTSRRGPLAPLLRRMSVMSEATQRTSVDGVTEMTFSFRTQELARLVAEDRQRQLGTFTAASVDAGPAAHTDTPAEVHDTTQREAALAEVSSTGVDVQQGTHESGLAPTEEPRSEPAQHPAMERRPEETLKEVAGVPLPVGSVEGAVHMSPGLEDIPTGQSVGVDDIRPSAQAEGIAPTTGGDRAVAGTVGMSPTLVVRTAVGPVVPHQAPFLEGFRRPAHGDGLVEERRVGRGACIPPVPTFAPSRTRPEIRHVATPRGSLPFGFMTAEELEDHGRRDLTEIDQCVLRSVPGEGKLPHVQDLSWGPASPSLPSGCSVAAPSGGAAGGLPSGGSVAAASGGVAGDLPSGGSVAAPSGGAAGPSSPLSAAPREGGSLTPRSVARRRRDITQRARELLDTMLFGRTDRPWSETRRVTTASAGRQPGLIGVSTSARRRDVVAAGFGGRGGGGDGSGGDGDDRREGAGSATTSAVDPPRTYGLREASIILEEPDVVTRLRQTQHVPLDRRQEGETSGTDGLPMAREAHRRDDLAAAAIRTVRGRRVIMDDDPDELPVTPEPPAGGRGGQRQRDREGGRGRSHGGVSHRSQRDPRVHDDR
ncbi:hypothetical protein CBR_g49473 [Chara braunii]|uniref:Uncharacterized protein n=1 Tax=Chara braunii TaxID=69332 RepID=A0A388K4Y0_CHABU|nr:hypothetical protein CBR_g49473 [Chara braunii]|eukprot:GBG65110.1 hypothetical protein CBR_g49473 [Chara braunii]